MPSLVPISSSFKPCEVHRKNLSNRGGSRCELEWRFIGLYKYKYKYNCLKRMKKLQDGRYNDFVFKFYNEVLSDKIPL